MKMIKKRAKMLNELYVYMGSLLSLIDAVESGADADMISNFTYNCQSDAL